MVRMLVVLVAGAAIGVATWLVVGSPFAKNPVTKAQIERAVAKRTAGKVQLSICNQEVVPTRTPQKNPPDRWTCDTYVGPTQADAQNGPSYRVLVSDDEITSIKRVPTH